jgi:hypothetical protein
MKEHKTDTVHFRIDPRTKKWLDLLADERSPAGTISNYLLILIHNEIHSHIADVAYDKGRDYAAEKFGLSDNVRLAIENPADIKGFLGSKENETKFIESWADGAILENDKLSKELDASPDVALSSLYKKYPNIFFGENEILIKKRRGRLATLDLIVAVQARKQREKEKLEEGKNA